MIPNPLFARWISFCAFRLTHSTTNITASWLSYSDLKLHIFSALHTHSPQYSRVIFQKCRSDPIIPQFPMTIPLKAPGVSNRAPVCVPCTCLGPFSCYPLLLLSTQLHLISVPQTCATLYCAEPLHKISCFLCWDSSSHCLPILATSLFGQVPGISSRELLKSGSVPVLCALKGSLFLTWHLHIRL